MNEGRTGLLNTLRTAQRATLSLVYRILYHWTVKTTLDLDDELLVRARAQAARERKSLTSLIEEGLRLRLRRRGPTRTGAASLAVFRGEGGLMKGVDPLSNRSLLEAADDDA